MAPNGFLGSLIYLPSALTTSHRQLGVVIILTSLMVTLVKFNKTDLVTLTPLSANLLKLPPATNIISLKVFKISLL